MIIQYDNKKKNMNHELLITEPPDDVCRDPNTYTSIEVCVEKVDMYLYPVQRTELLMDTLRTLYRASVAQQSHIYLEGRAYWEYEYWFLSNQNNLDSIREPMVFCWYNDMVVINQRSREEFLRYWSTNKLLKLGQNPNYNQFVTVD